MKRLTVCLVYCLLYFSSNSLVNAETWEVGFGNVDITPEEPVRLSGYSNRNQPFENVADPLFSRAMAITPAGAKEQQTLVLVSVDSIAVTAELTKATAAWAEDTFGLARSQLVLCSTHSHTAPQLASGLTNLYREPLSEQDLARTTQYTQKVAMGIQQAITAAIGSRRPAKLAIAETAANFAIQRRVIVDGKWTNFGETKDGQADRRVRVLICRASENNELLGAAYMYACHCTTLGPEFNRVSGDWAGLSAQRLQQLYPKATFLPVIGCGADANPTPRTGYEFANQHAATIVDSVQQALKSDATELTGKLQAHFGYAGLAPEIPDNAQIDRLAASENPVEKRWAAIMRNTLKTMGRLPESIPMPIHTWEFSDQLNWVFLGGEVVVDYQFAIEKAFPNKPTWVAAYSDDVFAYVASEAMLSEGGYEVDSSMIYYALPGRWKAGTQDSILARVREVFEESAPEERPLNAEQAIASMRVPDGFKIELVASEPLVQDPINIAFSPDGSVWIVEMSDYPQGSDRGGRIKRLQDTDGDGKLDRADLFLEGLSFPTSVVAWKAGAIFIAAPNVEYAADTDGDGKADKREVLLRGIAEANPQHRASGFEVGLDGWLHFAAGESTRELESLRNSQKYDVHNRDVAWNPETGEVLATTGETQFVRSRDEYGNWFGNSNSFPMYHYVIESRYLERSSIPGPRERHLLAPAAAPPVFPRSRTLDRFNDLYAHNRFTSACSSIVCRVPGLGKDMRGAGLVCEPVHNLVSRHRINSDGSSFVGSRFDEDKQFDFLTSSDPWSRPVRAVNAPDGTIWILDMYRRVIEHPQWIPTAWQAQLDLRSGHKYGRVYRVYRDDYRPQPLRAITTSATDLLPSLASDNGALRDLSLQRIVWDKTQLDHGLGKAQLQRLVREHHNPAVRVAALGTLAATGWLSEEDASVGLEDRDARVVRFSLEVAEPWLEKPSVRQRMVAVANRNLGPQVDLQWILSCLKVPSNEMTTELSSVAARSTNNPWIVRCLALYDQPVQSESLAQGLLQAAQKPVGIPVSTFAEIQQSLTRLWPRIDEARKTALLEEHFAQFQKGAAATKALSPAQLLLLTAYSQQQPDEKTNTANSTLLRAVADASRSRLLDDAVDLSEREALVNLLGCGVLAEPQVLADLEQLLSPRHQIEIQKAAVLTTQRLNSDKVTKLLIDNWPSLMPEVRSVASTGMLARKSSVDLLVKALESSSIRPADLDAATIQQLRANGDRRVRDRCENVFGKTTPRQSVVDDYLKRMPKNATPAEGEAVFREHCAVCHKPAEGKPMIGAAIDNLGHWSNEQWVTAIMDPNRAIEPKFHQYTVITTDEQLFAGIIQQRTNQSIFLAAADGNVREIKLTDIQAMKDSGTSLMPDGMESKLSPAQLAALIAYLRSR